MKKTTLIATNHIRKHFSKYKAAGIITAFASIAILSDSANLRQTSSPPQLNHKLELTLSDSHSTAEIYVQINNKTPKQVYITKILTRSIDANGKILSESDFSLKHRTVLRNYAFIDNTFSIKFNLEAVIYATCVTYEDHPGTLKTLYFAGSIDPRMWEFERSVPLLSLEPRHAMALSAIRVCPE